MECAKLYVLYNTLKRNDNKNNKIKNGTYNRPVERVFYTRAMSISDLQFHCDRRDLSVGAMNHRRLWHYFYEHYRPIKFSTDQVRMRKLCVTFLTVISEPCLQYKKYKLKNLVQLIVLPLQ